VAGKDPAAARAAIAAIAKDLGDHTGDNATSGIAAEVAA
jgi:hypothetical protein